MITQQPGSLGCVGEPRMEPAAEGLTTSEVGQEYLANGMLEDGSPFSGMGSLAAHVQN